MFHQQNSSLVREFAGETLVIQPWGKDGLRVRSTMRASFEDEDWALLPERHSTPAVPAEVVIPGDGSASLTHGRITARVDPRGQITFLNQKGDVLLQEFMRVRLGNPQRGDEQVDPAAVAYFNSALSIYPREFKAILGGDYAVTVRFESRPDEKLFGMGQYQHGFLNQKNCVLELAQRNSQASVPFALSSAGYGFLWNNPAIGKVTFGKNCTEWAALSAKQIDYWITAGDEPAAILANYAEVTGTVPIMPEYGLGLWQSKLRYQTQEELLAVAHEYKRRGLPLDVIVVDFFHWPMQGEYRFDPVYWPDPAAMVEQLEACGIKLMVSVWPTIDRNSSQITEMHAKGLLVRTERGVATTMEFLGDTVFFDATNPKAREHVWKLVKQNYYDKGVRIFWLDEAEPEYSVYDFDNYRYHLGPNLQVGNIYPLKYAQGFYEGMAAEKQENIVNLVRCAWAGSQRYGALVWSGDIDSSFESLRVQLAAGLNMGLAGIPWWTTDIGGFHGGVNTDPSFRECLIRWFQFATFSPVLRMHGDREPHARPLSTTGGGMCASGAPNELWSFGEETSAILEKYLRLRERLRPYLRGLMADAHARGCPLMRPLFYDFPQDDRAWVVEDAYMFGPDVLVAPILFEGQRAREVYLPAGAQWISQGTGEVFSGGQAVHEPAPIEHLPIFFRENGSVRL
ncbi:MAG: glycoside hydrolase family 31 protein [Verrucomicrobia bacterium]|nr:glycoside hydrolase family 31 protein [Verrucomicrobiota bacterium]